MSNLTQLSGQAVSWFGTDIINDTNSHFGNWKALVVLQAATFDTITDDGQTPSVIPTGVSLPAGTFLSANGKFTTIDLSAGMVAMSRAQ